MEKEHATKLLSTPSCTVDVLVAMLSEKNIWQQIFQTDHQFGD